MKRHPVSFVLSSSLAVLVFACAGCFGKTLGQEGSTWQDDSAARVLLYRRPASFPGPRDIANRYRSVIKVITAEKIDKESRTPLVASLVHSGGECSGVLIAPRLVVTAGHCVCMGRPFTTLSSEPPPTASAATPPRSLLKRKDAIKDQKLAAVIDSSECAKTSTVETIVYDPPTPGKRPGSRSQEYSGTVIPYPRLELLYNDTGDQVWSSSDLAVIVLAEPVNDFPAFKLATREVNDKDPIVMIGYGPGETYGTFGHRHVGENTVGWLRPLESGNMEFVASAQLLPDGGPASHTLAGDSGGGCLSKADGFSLVGITSSFAQNAKGERFSIFTSIYSHIGWLELQRKALALGARQPGDAVSLDHRATPPE
jgi:hypothetical protein